MGRSNRLTLEDIRSVFRLVGEVAELRLQPEAQQTHLANGLCRLMSAVQGYTVRFENFDIGTNVEIAQLYPGGEPNPAALAAWNHWQSQKGQSLRGDPLVDLSSILSGKGRGRGTYLRSEVIEDRVWYGSPVYEEMLDHGGIEHLAVSWFDLKEKQTAFGFAAQRMRGDHDFSVRERRIMALFNEELFHLYQQGKLTGAGTIEQTLSPRQVQLLRMLLLGQTPKRIAYELGLTVATVRTYIRDLYKRLGVHGREELMARYIRDGGIDSTGGDKP